MQERVNSEREKVKSTETLFNSKELYTGSEELKVNLFLNGKLDYNRQMETTGIFLIGTDEDKSEE